MLKEMGFLVYVEHPHKFIPNYIEILGLASDTNFMQAAWNYANDSLRTPLCIKFPPEVIATGCIALAARKVGIKFPEHLSWWELFDATEPHILSAC
jgi:cyclin T